MSLDTSTNVAPHGKHMHSETLAPSPAPLVSVIIPAYNVEAYVEAAVQSVLDQTLRDIEVIVVDDGSRDATGEILDRMAERDSRLTALHVENGGAPAARNLAIERARGRYMVFVDADDECVPTMLETLAGIMERDHCELAVCGFEIVTTTGYGNGEDSGDNTFVEVKSVPSATYRTAEEFHRASPELFDNNMFYPPWNKMFLSSRLNELNIRYRDVFWDDFPFVLDYIRDVQSVSMVSEPLYRFFRRRADSETARYRDGVFEKRETENDWMRELYAHWGMQNNADADEMVSRRYIERLVGCVANECSPKNPKSFGQKRAAVAHMLASPAVRPALAAARPRSAKMRLMLIPYRMRSATLCLASGMFIEWVRGAAPTLFAKLKAHR
ncbi:MAG: glycosyltransferase [Coriobacteriaceae bacterium]|nr:glycosyltransferase [Coriobacteriaceae bacterium]